MFQFDLSFHSLLQKRYKLSANLHYSFYFISRSKMSIILCNVAVERNPLKLSKSCILHAISMIWCWRGHPYKSLRRNFAASCMM